MSAKECTRSVLSCSRCRRRKTKCDRKLPSCSECVAGKAKCTGFSVAASSAEVPRSIVRHLEFEIARLETELASGGHLDALNASDILLQFNQEQQDHQHNPELINFNGAISPQDEIVPSIPQDSLTAAIMASCEVQSMISATSPYGPGLTDLVSRVRMGLTPSSTTTVNQVSELSRNSVSPRAVTIPKTQVEVRVLGSMPFEIVQNLVRKYVEKVLPQYPFLQEPTIWQQLEHVTRVLQAYQLEPATPGTCGVLPSYDFLVIYLVLAISVTLGCAKGGHESRCISLSASLFEEGIRHLSSEMQIPSDIAGLQMNLLILLYATINPRSANVWILSGAAMRSSLELGLHRESPQMPATDAVSLDLRRRIFWSAYCIDRSVCAALQRPVSIPDAAINTQFPSVRSTSEGETRMPFLGVIHYHQLLSEMIQVHFQGQPLPNNISWDQWLSSMEHKLRLWYEDSCHESGHNELVDFALARGLTILHRPSPRTPMPSQRSLLIAFDAASSSARSHRDHLLTGFFRRPWMSAHHTLETAMIVLFCLRHGCQHISEKFDGSRIFEMTKLFTLNFLTISSQGWSEVSSYAGVYERLLGPLLESVFSVSKNPEANFGPAQDAELTRLLYPGPAHLDKLRFGIQHGEDLNFSGFDFSLFDMDNDIFGLDGGHENVQASTGFTPGANLLDHALAFDDLGLVF